MLQTTLKISNISKIKKFYFVKFWSFSVFHFNQKYYFNQKLFFIKNYNIKFFFNDISSISLINKYIKIYNNNSIVVYCVLFKKLPNFIFINYFFVSLSDIFRYFDFLLIYRYKSLNFNKLLLL